jgi:hypothetical protein
MYWGTTGRLKKRRVSDNYCGSVGSVSFNSNIVKKDKYLSPLISNRKT